jgi:hypothetical protein
LKKILRQWPLEIETKATGSRPMESICKRGQGSFIMDCSDHSRSKSYLSDDDNWFVISSKLLKNNTDENMRKEISLRESRVIISMLMIRTANHIPRI